jgi:excisionase family DNA binding protein
VVLRSSAGGSPSAQPPATEKRPYSGGGMHGDASAVESGLPQPTQFPLPLTSWVAFSSATATVHGWGEVDIVVRCMERDGGAGGARSLDLGSVHLPPVAEQAEWLDVEAAARYLALHPSMIYRMIHEGRLAASRSPVRIRREDLDACLERCRIKPGDLAHMNAFAGGAHLAAERAVTKAGRPDRRYGRRVERIRGFTTPP